MEGFPNKFRAVSPDPCSWSWFRNRSNQRSPVRETQETSRVERAESELQDALAEKNKYLDKWQSSLKIIEEYKAVHEKNCALIEKYKANKKKLSKKLKKSSEVRQLAEADNAEMSQQLEEANQGWKQAEVEKAELSKELEEAKQGRQRAEADKAEEMEQLRISKKMLTCSEVANEKLRAENSALLEECAAGAISAICDQMQLEKLREDRSAPIAECGVGSMSAICDQIQLEKVELEKNLLSANYEKALAEIQANSVQLHFANHQIRKLKDEVNKFNAQENGKEKEENEVSEDVWHKKDALLIKDQCDEFKDAFELLHGAISSSLRNGMMASNEQILAENLSIAGKLAEKASSIRDGFMASTGTHVECIKDLLDDLLPCDDSAYSVTTENSDFEVIKE